MKKKLTDNWGLKIIAFLFAFILWLAVVNVDDPVISETFKGIPVQFLNTELLTDEGLTYEILEESNMIDSVTVYGPRTVVESLKENSIVATADFADITVANTVAVNISIDSRNASKITNVRSSLDSVKLNVEDSKSVQLVINTTTSGQTAKGYVVGDIKLDQNRITVSGPETIVSQIYSAKVDVNVTDANSDVATYGTVVLYDKQGNVIENSILVKSVETVHVDVNILPTKYVPITIELTGTPKTGYVLVEENITCDIETVMLAGENDVLKDITELVIGGEALDITDATEEMSFDINLKDYLPDGVTLGDKTFEGKVNITAPIDEIVTEVVELLEGNITITNVPTGFKAEIANMPIYYEFDITGAATKVREAMANDLQCVIDMDELLIERGVTEWRAGTYNINLTPVLPEGVTMSDINVTLTVSKGEE